MGVAIGRLIVDSGFRKSTRVKIFRKQQESRINRLTVAIKLAAYGLGAIGFFLVIAGVYFLNKGTDLMNAVNATPTDWPMLLLRYAEAGARPAHA